MDTDIPNIQAPPLVKAVTMDKEIGSIEVGKRADFAMLGEDPLAVEPAHLKDVPVLGTVLGGQPVAI